MRRGNWGVAGGNECPFARILVIGYGGVLRYGAGPEWLSGRICMSLNFLMRRV